MSDEVLARATLLKGRSMFFDLTLRLRTSGNEPLYVVEAVVGNAHGGKRYGAVWPHWVGADEAEARAAFEEWRGRWLASGAHEIAPTELP